MLAGIVLNFAANWSPGGGELHPDLILTSPDGPLTIDEVCSTTDCHRLLCLPPALSAFGVNAGSVPTVQPSHITPCRGPS